MPTSIKRKKKFRAQKSESSGGACFDIYQFTLFIAHLFPINRRVTRPHGSSGVVKSKFRSNLPPRAFGASVRVVRLNQLSVHNFSLTLFTDALPLEHLNRPLFPPRIVCCNMTRSHMSFWNMNKNHETLLMGRDAKFVPFFAWIEGLRFRLRI